MMKNETVGDLLKRTGMTLDQLFTEFCKCHDSHKLGVIWTEETHNLKGKERENVRRAKMHKSPAGL